MLEYREHITRAMIQAERDKLFVFGDNFLRYGRGGQAKEMRGEPNSVGIVTKRRPSNDFTSFLTDDDEDEWLIKNEEDINRLKNFKGIVVWPNRGIGTGLAKLEKSSVRIWLRIKMLERELFVTYKG